MVYNCKPLAFRGDKLNLGLVKEGKLIVGQLGCDLVFSFVAQVARRYPMVQLACAFAEVVADDGVITAP